MSGINANRKVLIVDPDEQHCAILGDALMRHDFQVWVAHDAESALALATHQSVGNAVVDLRAPDHEGLKLVEQLKASNGDARIVVLATHPSIATAVEAIKRGANHYLPKPVRTVDVVAMFSGENTDTPVPLEARPLSLDALIWEYIDRVLVGTGGNVSAAARALDMHRRTLQRKLRQRTLKARSDAPSARSRAAEHLPVEAG
jgi:two-component system response regulator RegA